MYNESIQYHSKNNFEKYDIVCSYQVLEHIGKPYSFLKSQIDCLKIGGKLIISVPNNDSFIKLDKGGILNMPPHHMGLWKRRSLKNLTKVFNLKVVNVHYEPLQDYHLDWYVDSFIEKRINKNVYLRRIFEKFFSRKFIRAFAKRNYKRIRGHTIMVEYIKHK